MRTFLGFLCGLVFGIGLIIAQMTNPAKVIGFLDLLNGWDPSLAFVMASGLVVFAVGFFLTKGRQRTFLGGPVVLPQQRQIDRPLIIGAVLFGLGWGLSGLCPGPAITSLTLGGTSIYVFVASMVGGMALYQAYARLNGAQTGPSKT